MQFVSDVNVLAYKGVPNPPEREEPLLVIAGNVGPADDWRTEAYIYNCCEQFEFVIWVPGNMELWCSQAHVKKRHYSEMMSLLYDLENELDNLKVLNNESFEYKGWHFIGSTLWTHIPPEHLIDVKMNVDDYKYILNHFHEPIEVERTNMWHNNAVHTLNIALHGADSKQRNVVVVTHFPPLSYGVNKPEIEHGSPRLLSAYTNSLIWLVDRHQHKIHTWAWGHTQKPFDNSLLYKDMRLMCCTLSST